MIDPDQHRSNDHEVEKRTTHDGARSRGGHPAGYDLLCQSELPARSERPERRGFVSFVNGPWRKSAATISTPARTMRTTHDSTQQEPTD